MYKKLACSVQTSPVSITTIWGYADCRQVIRGFVVCSPTSQKMLFPLKAVGLAKIVNFGRQDSYFDKYCKSLFSRQAFERRAHAPVVNRGLLQCYSLKLDKTVAVQTCPVKAGLVHELENVNCAYLHNYGYTIKLKRKSMEYSLPFRWKSFQRFSCSISSNTSFKMSHKDKSSKIDGGSS